jgi:ABC-type polysaccharide/polyol phosphate export permease
MKLLIITTILFLHSITFGQTKEKPNVHVRTFAENQPVTSIVETIRAPSFKSAGWQ